MQRKAQEKKDEPGKTFIVRDKDGTWIYWLAYKNGYSYIHAIKRVK